MYLKKCFLIPLVCWLTHYASVSSHALHEKSEQSLSLHNCNKDKLLQLPDSSVITNLNIHCYVPALENAFFIRFTSLINLEITESKLTVLGDYALHGLRHLRLLSLAYNNLTEVKSWSNEQMSSLISLDLRRNAIRKLTIESFARYPNLQRLNLKGNLLEDIDDGVFHWMPQLKYLNLGHNRLIALENRNFHGMHRLSYLALHFNAIKMVEIDSFDTNNHLRTLRLEGNKLKDLEFLKVKSLMRLQHLNLSFNELETLNGIMSFSKDYEIIDLDLSNNFIKEINEDDLLGLETLTKLNISHNLLNHIAAESFNKLFNLEFLELNHNKLQHVHNFLFNTTSYLQHINLSNNKLSSINTTLFSSLSDLKTLDLSENQLSNDEFIEYLASEVSCNEMRLNLSDNHYRAVNITSLLCFEQVELAGNWWSCKWLIKEMFKIPKSISFGRTYVINTEWSLSMLDAKGINCYDEDSRRNLIILDTSKVWEQRFEEVMCGQTASLELQPPPPSLSWPRIKSDRFDSRSVVLWMLIAIALAFSALRIGRKLIDQKERKRISLKVSVKEQAEQKMLQNSLEDANRKCSPNCREKHNNLIFKK